MAKSKKTKQKKKKKAVGKASFRPLAEWLGVVGLAALIAMAFAFGVGEPKPRAVKKPVEFYDKVLPLKPIKTQPVMDPKADCEEDKAPWNKHKRTAYSHAAKIDMSRLVAEIEAEDKAVDYDQGPDAAPVPKRTKPAPPPKTAPIAPPEGFFARNRARVAAPEGKALVAIIIDDMGLNGPRNRAVSRMHPDLTLSFLTYAPNLARQISAARKDGHEVMLHVPMQAANPKTNSGPHALKTGMSRTAVRSALFAQIAAARDGFMGFNNHTGSRFTEDAKGMAEAMEVAKAYGMVFVDSRTSPASVAYAEAEKAGVPALKRDVFLDHEDGEGAILAQLQRLERIARKRGWAVGIGHPRPNTIAVLSRWTAALPEDLALVPLSTVIDKTR